MKKHGHTTKTTMSLTYVSWAKMISRCNNPNNIKYSYYGGRGIKVCNRWLKFDNFLEDMGERPKNLTLDRIDVNKGYYKENCRWVSRKTQAQNRRGNLNSTSKYKGVSWSTERKKWVAHISINRKSLALGRFSNEIEAARAYNIAALKYFGEDAYINEIE